MYKCSESSDCLPDTLTWHVVSVPQDVVLGAAVLVAAHVAAALVARFLPVRPGAHAALPLQMNRHLPWPMALVLLHMFGLQHLRWQYMRALAHAAVADLWRLVVLPSALQAWLWEWVPLPQSLAWLHALVAKWGLLVCVGYGVWKRGVRCVGFVAVLLRARLAGRRQQVMWENVGGILEYTEPRGSSTGSAPSSGDPASES
jgi:hypothetical protein